MGTEFQIPLLIIQASTLVKRYKMPDKQYLTQDITQTTQD